MTRIYLSLGSNMGNRAQNIARAIEALGERGVHVMRESSLYETEPVDVLDGGWFLNGVVEAETESTPERLMSTLLEIERSLGRQRTRNSGGRKESRTIDIDILFFGSTVMNTPDLKIPHPRMAERRFVLVPLAEIAGDAEHSVLKKTVTELLAATSDRSEVRLKTPK